MKRSYEEHKAAQLAELDKLIASEDKDLHTLEQDLPVRGKFALIRYLRIAREVIKVLEV